MATVQQGDLAGTITDVGDEGVAQVVDAPRTAWLARSSNIADAGRIGTARPRPAAPPSRPSSPRTTTRPSGTGSGRCRLRARTDRDRLRRHQRESVHEASQTLTRALLLGVPLVTARCGAGHLADPGPGAAAGWTAIRSEVDSITEAELQPPGPDQPRRRRGRTAGLHHETACSTGSRPPAPRQRDFVADASHDLQAPWAAQRAQLEVALTSSGHVDVPALARDLLAGTSDMERLVRDLLFLATDDGGAPAPTHVPLDLDVLLLEEAARLRPATDVHLEVAGVSAAPVRGDAGELRRLVRNLLENAARYAGENGRVTAGIDGDRVRVEIADDGPGVPAAEAEQVFERFHRGDAARSRDDGGSGLGWPSPAPWPAATAVISTLDPADDGARFVLLLPADL